MGVVFRKRYRQAEGRQSSRGRHIVELDNQHSHKENQQSFKCSLKFGAPTDVHPLPPLCVIVDKTELPSIPKAWAARQRNLERLEVCCTDLEARSASRARAFEMNQAVKSVVTKRNSGNFLCLNRLRPGLSEATTLNRS